MMGTVSLRTAFRRSPTSASSATTLEGKKAAQSAFCFFFPPDFDKAIGNDGNGVLKCVVKVPGRSGMLVARTASRRSPIFTSSATTLLCTEENEQLSKVCWFFWFLVPCSLFLVSSFVFLVPCSLFLVPCSLFRVPCPVSRVPCSVFRVPCSLFPVP
jgi:hypothetical protein